MILRSQRIYIPSILKSPKVRKAENHRYVTSRNGIENASPTPFQRCTLELTHSALFLKLKKWYQGENMATRGSRVFLLPVETKNFERRCDCWDGKSDTLVAICTQDRLLRRLFYCIYHILSSYTLLDIKHTFYIYFGVAWYVFLDAITIKTFIQVHKVKFMLLWVVQILYLL